VKATSRKAVVRSALISSELCVHCRGPAQQDRGVGRFERGLGIGPWRMDASSSEVLAVAFDHLPMRVYARVAR